jgi:triacylglycerol lipase
MELLYPLLSLFLFVASLSASPTPLGNPSDNALAKSSDNVVVSIRNAKVVGQHLPLSNASIFYGVPYAQPPVGNLRFRPPQPVDKYLGTLNATSRGNWCLRVEFLPTPQDSEDCLNLDIVVPDRKDGDNQLYPVIFFIHG